MSRILSLGVAVAAFCAAATALAADAPPPPNGEIAFANHGGIWDWRADGHDAILVKSRSGQYYRATFMSPCFSLPFAEQVGFVTDSREVLDKFQSIDVGHERCQFQTFTEIPKPGNW